MNIYLLWTFLILLLIGTIISIFEAWRYARQIRQHLKVKIDEEEQMEDDKDVEARDIILSIHEMILSAKLDEMAVNFDKNRKINIESPANTNSNISIYGPSDAEASDNFYRPNRGHLRRVK